MIISFLDMFAEQFKHCQCRNSSIQALESKPGGYLLFCFAHLSFANTSTSATDLRLTEAKRSASIVHASSGTTCMRSARLDAT